MKPRFLGVLAVLGSLGFAWWLLSGPHSSRELFLSMVAWVLGFWVASGLRPIVAADADPDDDEAEDE